MTPTQHTMDASLLTTAYGDHKKGLSSRATHKIHDTALSDDLVQITFMKTWMYLVRGGKIDLMKAFLYHVLNGLIIDEYRKHKALSLDVLVGHGFDPSTDTTGKLYNILDGKTALKQIARLPKKYQAVMRMRYIEGLTLAEMSVRTGQTKNTLAVQAHRGVEMLKELYNVSPKQTLTME